MLKQRFGLVFDHIFFLESVVFRSIDTCYMGRFSIDLTCLFWEFGTSSGGSERSSEGHRVAWPSGSQIPLVNELMLGLLENTLPSVPQNPQKMAMGKNRCLSSAHQNGQLGCFFRHSFSDQPAEQC